MKNKELVDIAKQLWKLEEQCQKGENIAENFSKMEEIMEDLSIEDCIQVTMLLESYQEEQG
jgi:DNA-binding transcriptional regulator PaaX